MGEGKGGGGQGVERVMGVGMGKGDEGRGEAGVGGVGRLCGIRELESMRAG